MAAPKQIAASGKDYRGRTVVLTQERWEHIVEGHEQLDGHEMAVMTAVEKADKRGKGNFTGAEVIYGRGLGPARWLAVVVAYSGLEGQVITAYPHTKEPKPKS